MVRTLLQHLTAVSLLLAALFQSVPARAEQRIALVVTNQDYKQAGARLTNTHRDGDLVKAALEKVGFKVWLVRDTASEGTLLGAIGEHVQRLAEAGPEAVGFLYYSGHGAADRPDGANYLIPTDAPLTHVAQLPLMAVRLDRITATLASAGKMSFVVFDACRNVALQRESKDFGFKGFAPIREQRGLLVAYATEPGNVAVDQNIYARALAAEIVRPGREAGQAFRAVTRRVEAATGAKQSPEFLDKRRFDFYFAAVKPVVAPVAVQPKPEPPPTKRPAELAVAVVQPPPRCSGIEVDVVGSGKACLDPANAGNREFQDCFTANGQRQCGPRMVVIPPGRFLMGSSDDEIAALIKQYPQTNDVLFKSEGPEHDVSIGRAFAVGRTHVTRGQFAAFVAATGHKTDGGCHSYDGKEWKLDPARNWQSPGFDQDDRHPVVCVNWHDAQAYAAWIKQATGHDYRLLTEAEAEYAARGTTRASRQPRYSFGNDTKELCKHGNGADLTGAAKFNWIKAQAAPCEDGHATTASVASFAANPFGLHDVHGNAWSWVQDCFIDNYKDALSNGRSAADSADCPRVLRGSSWFNGPQFLRSAHRLGNRPGVRSYLIGFRLTRTLNP